MPQIIPIKELKNTSEISDLCHKTNEPIYVTKNGYGDMVIMSIEKYESTLKKLEMYQDIAIIPKTKYILVFDIREDTVFVLGIFHQLENYWMKV